MSWINKVYQFHEKRAANCHDLAVIDGVFAANFVLYLSEVEQAEYGEDLFSILAVLNAATRDGHTCLNIAEVANSTWFESPDLKPDNALFKPGVMLPDKDTLFHVLNVCLPDLPKNCLVFERGLLYLHRYYNFEQDIALALSTRLSDANVLSPETQQKCEKAWPSLFAESDFSLATDDQQQVAAIRSLTHSTLIINGGPGTGKTYTAARVLALLGTILGSERPLRVKLAAPTGKAAQRLTESILSASTTLDMSTLTEFSAVTLHRLLGLRKGMSDVRYNQSNPIPSDVILVDEASMIDTALMARLFRAIGPNTRLILLGDANQLPSVEAGSVLEDLVVGLGNTTFGDTVVTLNQTRRFSGDLKAFASSCLDGNSAEAIEVMHRSNVLNWVSDARRIQDLKTLALEDFASIKHAQTLQDAFNAMHATRWLTPFRKGEWGVEGMNSAIEEWVFSVSRSSSSSSPSSHKKHYRGQVIMVMENHPSTGLFNGDVGLVWPDDSGQLSAFFELADGQLKRYSLARLPRVETAFVMTIHKSQGSEFARPRLVLPSQSEVSPQAWRIVTRALVYTAITRAKSQLSLVSDEHAFSSALSAQHRRMSGLKRQLEHIKNQKENKEAS